VSVWTQVHESQLPELESFAHGVERDKAAVQAGLTLPINNGQGEGQVTRIKLIKRMMYGKAGFALLRQRVLPRISWTPFSRQSSQTSPGKDGRSSSPQR